MSTSIFRADLLAGQVAIVTGGGSGIGRATAAALLATGAQVAIAGRRSELLAQAAAELGAAGGEVLAAPCDIREPDQCERLVDATLARFGRLDLLVNNAGGQFPAPAIAISPRGWEAVIRNNLNGTFYMTRAAATRALIPAGRGGRIVNVTAMVDRGFPGMAHTGAARAGVENLTRTLAVEWAAHRVLVNAVAPGVIRSSGTERYPPELVELAARRTPLKRPGSVDEVAAAIVFLASPAAGFITGATLHLDGGARLWGDTWPIPD